jgi:transcriptional antiterminator RfaH
MDQQVETTSSPIAELSPCVTQEPWFCIRSHLKHEHIAAAHLRLIPGVQVFNPQLRLLRLTRRGRVWSTESLFPSYLFSRFDLESMLEKIRYTASVKTVLQFGAGFPTIPHAAIHELQRDLDELKSKVLTDAPEEGEEVEVAAGALRGLKGPVVRVLPAKQRVQILLEVMGRSIAADLSLELVLFKKRNAVNLVLDGAEVDCRGWPKIPSLALESPRVEAKLGSVAS